MATLNSSNIVNGNVVQPNDLLQLYDALTAGGGTTGVYDVSISGSLTGSATTATNASKLNPSINASTNANYNVLFAATSSATYEEVYKENGTIMTYNPSTNLLNVTSSRATTASYAENGGLATQVYQQQYERLSGGALDATFKFVAGSVQATAGVATTSAFSSLVGKSLGNNVFITATINSGSANTGLSVVVKTLSGGAITFNTEGGNGSELILYQAFILQ
jgi:hypothetical protein